MALLHEIVLKVTILVVFLILKYYIGSSYPGALGIIATSVGAMLTKL